MTLDAADDTSFGGWRSCDVCGEAIATIEEGALIVRAAVLEERRAVRAAREPGVVNPDGFVPWDWGHRECVEALAPLHLIEGPRISTLPRMMARTLQLLDEEWFGETAWEDAVRRFYAIPFE